MYYLYERDNLLPWESKQQRGDNSWKDFNLLQISLVKCTWPCMRQISLKIEVITI